MATARDLQLAFYKHTVQRYEIVAPNIHLDWQFNEMDILGLRRSGYVDEVEIKLTRSDFLADFKKKVKVKDGKIEIVPGHFHTNFVDTPKHDAVKQGLAHCNYFSFLMPESLADKCEIPEYAGLYIYKERSNWIVEVKKAPLLHKRKISEQLKYEIGRKMAYRYWNKVA